MTLTYKEKKARREERALGRKARDAEQAKYGGEERYRIICDLEQHLFKARELLFSLRCETDKGPIPASLREIAGGVTFHLSRLD
jgi:hypothetical protein